MWGTSTRDTSMKTRTQEASGPDLVLMPQCAGDFATPFSNASLVVRLIQIFSSPNIELTREGSNTLSISEESKRYESFVALRNALFPTSL